MGLHVVIATAGRSDLLERTLAALAAAERPPSYRGLLLVENGGQPTAADLAEAYADRLGARHLFEPVGNKNRALNRAVRELAGGVAVLFDDDVRVDPGVLTAYAAAAERRPDAPFFAGRCGCDYVEPPPAWLVPMLPLSAKGWGLERDGAPITLPHAMGFNWAVRVEAIRRLGGFREDRGPGTSVSVGDEYEMQRRLIRELGPGVFVDGARVWHYVPPERCSERWLVARAFHYGVAKAIARRDDEPGRGVPLWAWRRLATSTVKRFTLGLVAGRATRVKTRYGVRLNRGLVAGFRLPPPDPDAAPATAGPAPAERPLGPATS